MKKNRVVVITGASAGVGRAIAHAFAKKGDRIALLARGQQGLEDCRQEVIDLGGEALVIRVDVSDAQALFKAADKIEETFGPIDIWVNNAMVSVFSPVKEMTPEEFKRVTDVTYLGVVNGTLAALQRMLPRNKGRILQIGSALAYRSIPLQSAYCAAKHAVIGFTSSLRSELLHDKSEVTATVFELPAVNTPQFRWVRSRLPRQPQPVPPIFQPEVIADAVVWAAESGRRSLIIGWSAFEAIWADKLAPGAADHFLAQNGYDSQQTQEPTQANRRDNLYEPVSELASTRGDFSDQAKDNSPFLWATKHCVALAGAAIFGLGVWLASRQSTDSNKIK